MTILGGLKPLKWTKANLGWKAKTQLGVFYIKRTVNLLDEQVWELEFSYIYYIFEDGLEPIVDPHVGWSRDTFFKLSAAKDAALRWHVESIKPMLEVPRGVKL